MKDDIMYFVCNEAPLHAVPLTKRKQCDAGCGRVVLFPMKVPDKPPKICPVCADWVNNCEGMA